MLSPGPLPQAWVGEHRGAPLAVTLSRYDLTIARTAPRRRAWRCLAAPSGGIVATVATHSHIRGGGASLPPM
ncbi:hypothetical protein LBMAG42_05410 [Deltaproteobacteria bacterium]|nr:hypothetical protein LBMAG42_05410 [Deltaproteobacteria bacterium]